MHPYETFHRQFLLAKQCPDLPDDWAADSIADWTFRWHPTLQVNAVTDRSGAKIGWLLGHLVDLSAGRTCCGDFELPFAGSQTGTVHPQRHRALRQMALAKRPGIRTDLRRALRRRRVKGRGMGNRHPSNRAATGSVCFSIRLTATLFARACPPCGGGSLRCRGRGDRGR